MSSAHALRRLIGQSIAMHEAVAASLGINATDLRCLELLQDEPDITPSRLAERLSLTSGAVTGVLDRLEAAGFVRREADAGDRRRIMVRPVRERMAEIEAAYRPLAERAATVGTDREPGGYLRGLVAALAAETDRVRVATEGGLLDDTYHVPMSGIDRARLLLVTGAPRLNFAGSGFGQQVRVVAETAATRLRLRPGPPAGDLVRATFVGPPPSVRAADGSVTMRYRRRMLDTRSREIEAQLNPSATWSIEVDGGITDLDGDLRELAIAALEVRGGANHVRLRLPSPSGTVGLRLAGGSSDVRITRPAGIPVAVAARGGVAHLQLDDQHRRMSAVDLRLESADYASVPDRYLLEFDGPVARLSVRGE